MKINENNEKYIIYEKIHVGECFACGGISYMKCSAPNGLPCDVNLETGKVSSSLDNSIKVEYLKNGTFYKYGGMPNEN